MTEIVAEERPGSIGNEFLSSASPTESLTATPTTNTVDSTSSSRCSIVTHKLTKQDTLAGLAVRYNVSVGDIKRANGLLSDNALYARETIQIPIGGLHLGEELQLIFAQVATGFGRDPVLNAEANAYPASAAAARVARTLNIINGSSYPPDDDSGLPWWCHCGGCNEDGNKNECRSRQFTDSDEEFELQERNATSEQDTGGPTRMHRKMRRRKGHQVEGDSDDGSLAQQGQRRAMRPPRPMAPMGIGTGSSSQDGEVFSGVLQHFQDLGKAIENSSLFQKIKSAASQPALAGPRKHSLAEAAEGVLTSVKAGLLAGLEGGLSKTSQNSLAPVLPTSHPSSSSLDSSMHRLSKGGHKDD